MGQDGGAAATPTTSGNGVSSCGSPALLTSTLSVALVWSTRRGLVSGHAQPRSGKSRGSVGQGSPLRLQDQAELVSA